MKLTQHELILYVDDDYRENVLKSYNGSDKIKELTAQELLEDIE